MDSEKNYFYLKTANDAGIASIRVFEFEEKQNNINTVVNTADLQNYVSKEEFEELKQVLNNINNTLLANISKQEEPVVNSSSTSKYKEKKEV